MRSQLDPLYLIFEQHLFNALVEDETTDQFLDRVVADYLARLSETSVIPEQVRASLHEDLRDEVLEMFRKKTYGFFDVGEFRRSSRGVGPALAGFSSGSGATARAARAPIRKASEPAEKRTEGGKPARPASPRLRRRRPA